MKIIRPHTIKLISILVVFLLTLLLTPGVVYAQSEFEEWAESRKKRFEEYRTEREKKFHEFLKQRWEDFRVFAGLEEDTAPKPDVIPVADPEESPEKKKLASVKVEEPGAGGKSPAREPTENRKVNGTTKDLPRDGKSREGDAETVSFLGQDLKITSAGKLRNLSVSSIDNESIAEFWSDFSARNTSPILEDLERRKNELRLDDWGYLQLVNTLSDRLVEDPDTSRLITWALLLKSGYDVKLGYNNNRTYLLVNADQKFYGLPYFRLDGRRYFVYTSDRKTTSISRIRTYRKSFPGRNQSVVINLTNLPRTSQSNDPRTLQFAYHGDTYTYEISSNRHLMDYLDSIPQLSLKEYFYSSSGYELPGELVDALREDLRPLGDEEKLEFLLRFVQNAFPYETDGKHFGRENYLLPVETLHYGKSDCEDRALLFSVLVNKLLEEKVVGLNYPGHVATAVRRDKFRKGSYLKINDHTFIVADPTYLNAGPGRIMPKYKNTNPKVLPTWTY